MLGERGGGSKGHIKKEEGACQSLAGGKAARLSSTSSERALLVGSWHGFPLSLFQTGRTYDLQQQTRGDYT